MPFLFYRMRSRGNWSRDAKETEEIST